MLYHLEVTLRKQGLADMQLGWAQYTSSQMDTVAAECVDACPL